MKKILVGIDGSHASVNALKYAVKMARLLRADIVGIAVINEIILQRILQGYFG